jgi:hypothetical protein
MECGMKFGRSETDRHPERANSPRTSGLPQADAAEQGARRPPGERRSCAQRHLLVLRSGAPWRDLPNAFGPYTTCSEPVDLAASIRSGKCAHRMPLANRSVECPIGPTCQENRHSKSTTGHSPPILGRTNAANVGYAPASDQSISAPRWVAVGQ